MSSWYIFPVEKIIQRCENIRRFDDAVREIKVNDVNTFKVFTGMNFFYRFVTGWDANVTKLVD